MKSCTGTTAGFWGVETAETCVVPRVQPQGMVVIAKRRLERGAIGAVQNSCCEAETRVVLPVQTNEKLHRYDHGHRGLWNR
jgi:hypothetical protein